ncbi:G-protein coupled receptor family C group 5 member B [Lemur catta]|uniref:G-protein coupled receptor family C group 5 member B n=1 Tax=Lemur catta TaxID=9447 RepID=UPI001E26AB55|nr:G-protein coupled receptor family C group 5 member B [Lemur catta]
MRNGTGTPGRSEQSRERSVSGRDSPGGGQAGCVRPGLYGALVTLEGRRLGPLCGPGPVLVCSGEVTAYEPTRERVPGEEGPCPRTPEAASLGACRLGTFLQMDHPGELPGASGLFMGALWGAGRRPLQQRGPGQGAPRAAEAGGGDAVKPDPQAGVRGAGAAAALQRCDSGRGPARASALRGGGGRVFVVSERKMRTHQVLTLLLLSAIASVASENASTSRGCGLDLLPQYVSLCDLDAIWGIVVEAVAGAGALITLLLTLILLVRLPFIKDKEKKSPVGLHFLFLLGTLGLFGLTFAFIIQEDETICSVRRFLWGVLFALCFSCLLSQAWRVRRLVRHGTGPAGWQLVGLALCLMLVQVIIAVEWLVLTVLRDTRPACAYEPMDFVMALIYDMVLLVVTLGLALFTLCGKFKRWKLNGAFLLITAFLSVLIWVAWTAMYLFGNGKLQQGDAWDDPTLAITLAASGWVFVIFHAIPEIHCTLLPALQENTPNYFDTSQPRMRETAFEEDVQLPRTYMENKAFSMDEHNAALRTAAGFPNGSLGKRPSGSLGKRPSAPFRSNVYQPTEMAVVLNGGTIPTAPPSHTGRHLW